MSRARRPRPHDAPLLVPPGARDEEVAAAGGRWRVLRAEPASSAPSPQPPFLLVHGGGSDHAGISWYRALPDLGAHRPVIAPDLPGFGGSTGVPILGPPAAMADQLVQLLDELGVERVVAVGVSLGGDVALNLALRHPERVAALVAVAPGGLIPRFRGPLTHRLVWLCTRLPDRVVMSTSDASSRWIDRVLARSVVDVSALPRAAVDEFLRVSRLPWAGYAYWRYNKASIGPAGMRNDLSGRLADVATPALFLHARADPLVPIDSSRRAVATMPDARLVEVPGVGHWLPLEAPEVFAAQVIGFLHERGL